MTIELFNQTIDTWITELQRYSIADLTAKPTPTSWSIGQLYKHLIADTNFYINRITVCVASNRNSYKEMTAEGKELFRNKSFPDERLQGAPSNSRIPQPVNKEELLEEFAALRREMNTAAVRMHETVFKGKAKHPGLGYLNASEWLQFADMHMRHHLRQKKRIDGFLISSR
jgi:uncharacterized damage-inducible protein DinB